MKSAHGSPSKIKSEFELYHMELIEKIIEKGIHGVLRLCVFLEIRLESPLRHSAENSATSAVKFQVA